MTRDSAWLELFPFSWHDAPHVVAFYPTCLYSLLFYSLAVAMSKARSYFNDLPSISLAPSRAASGTTSKPRASFKPPRPRDEAVSKGTMASKSGVQKRAQAKKTAADKQPSKKTAVPRKTTKTSAPAQPSKRALPELSDSDGDEDSDSKATTAKQPHRAQAARRRSSATPESILDSDSEPADSKGSSDSEPNTTLASRRASAHHGGGSAAGTSKGNGAAAALGDGPPPIPQKLLTRLLYEGFEDKGVRVGREAMAVYGKYVETFVREALARAIFEREDAGKEGDAVGDGFVQVEDLERITPQLVLDF